VPPEHEYLSLVIQDGGEYDGTLAEQVVIDPAAVG
jgi:hypothetical protein